MNLYQEFVRIEGLQKTSKITQKRLLELYPEKWPRPIKMAALLCLFRLGLLRLFCGSFHDRDANKILGCYVKLAFQKKKLQWMFHI